MLKAPAGQAEQDVWPSALVVSPSGHVSQVAWPAAAAKAPLAHGVQVEASVAPSASDAVPAAHGLHPSPATSAYVPAGQAVQVVDPVPEAVPSRHATHCAGVAEKITSL